MTVVRACVLPLVLYLVLRPENYGLTPNSLDPFFYTGYGINLDDMLAAGGLDRYYVTRWTLYMPVHLCTQVFGPLAGRLVLRLVLAAGVLLVLWRFGRRWNWTVHQQMLAGVVLLTMPMFVRAFFTDYFEYALVGYGLLLVMLCLRRRHTLWSAAAIGVLVAALLITNPFSVVIIAGPVSAAWWFGADTWRRRAQLVGSTIGAFVVVVVVGLLYFRWRYGLDNIYRPTIDFLGEAGRDPLSSKRLTWLGRYVWVFGPPIVGAVYLAIVRVRRAALDRTERLLLIMGAAQYCLHIMNQLTTGDGLEISYYWSSMYPVFGTLLVVGLARAAHDVRPAAVYVVLAAWITLLVVGVPQGLRLPHGVWFVLLMVVLLAGVVRMSQRTLFGAAAVVLLLLGWMHLGPPPYEAPVDEVNTSPRYDLLYRGADTGREAIYANGVWFIEQMDRVPNDEDAWFICSDGLGVLFFLMYGVASSGHGIDAALPPADAVALMLAEHDRDEPLRVAFLGSAAQVDEYVREWSRTLSPGTRVLDTSRGGPADLRLVVVAWDDVRDLEVSQASS